MNLPRVNHTCVTLLLSLIKVAGFVDEGRQVHVIYLTFSKAFDTVLHNILVSKPGCCRLAGWIPIWLKIRWMVRLTE